MTEPEMTLAESVLAALGGRGWSLAAAESLTGGLVLSGLVSVPGASSVVRGGVVAYATDVKRDVLGVDGALLARIGAVDVEVARQMARGARRVMGAHVGLATTGVAGPDSQDGAAVGTVHIAVETPEASRVWSGRLTGDRESIRCGAVDAALALCLSTVVPDQDIGDSHPSPSPAGLE